MQSFTTDILHWQYPVTCVSSGLIHVLVCTINLAYLFYVGVCHQDLLTHTVCNSIRTQSVVLLLIWQIANMDFTCSSNLIIYQLKLPVLQLGACALFVQLSWSNLVIKSKILKLHNQGDNWSQQSGPAIANPVAAASRSVSILVLLFTTGVVQVFSSDSMMFTRVLIAVVTLTVECCHGNGRVRIIIQN